MSQKNYESHWSGSSYILKFFVVTPSFLAPVPILVFFHPLWFIAASATWMGLIYWLSKKGLGILGIAKLLRRWLQGNHLRPHKLRRD